jgi:hypothetical protein
VKAAILTVITAPPGFAVDLFGGLLSVYRQEDGKYTVMLAPTSPLPAAIMLPERIYDDPALAVDEFLKLRDQLQLGYDYERTPA